MKENTIKNKSFAFAVRVVKIYQILCEQKKEFVLSKQLLRSGTFVRAMVLKTVKANFNELPLIRKFTEASSEKSFIELLEQEGFPHLLGITITRTPEEAFKTENVKSLLALPSQLRCEGKASQLNFKMSSFFANKLDK